MNAPEIYEIRVKGHLSVESMWFDDVSIRHDPNGETILSGFFDQAALHGVLMKIRDMGLELISVCRIQRMEGS